MHTITTVSEELKIHTLHDRRRHSDVLFVSNIYDGCLTRLSFLESAGKNSSEKTSDYFGTSYTSFTRIGCPCVRHALTASDICNRPYVMFDNKF